MLLSIFTPTYNRGHLLPRLFDSLQQQKCHNFEWIIVDDGSSDNTQDVVNSFIKEAKFPIIYEKKLNEGKHIAINRGVALSTAKLFFIVDSDDYLTADATSLIEDYYPNIQNQPHIAGVSFRRGYSSTQFIGSPFFEDIICSVFNFRYTKKITGDMAEVFKVEVLRNYPFPKINDEKFCPEALVWNRIGLKFDFLWTSHIIYIGEYLTGGLTDNIFNVRKKSPIGTSLYYFELESYSIPIVQKIKANINFWRFIFYCDRSMRKTRIKKTSFISILGLPLAIILRILKKEY